VSPLWWPNCNGWKPLPRPARNGSPGRHRVLPCLEILESRTLLATGLVRDINPTFDSVGAAPANLIAITIGVTDTLFFVAADEVHGAELWKSDGSTNGTVLVKDITPGVISSSPRLLTNVNGTLFFWAGAANQEKLWKSDGTANGTVLVKDINPGGGSTLQSLTNVNGTLFFGASDSNGIELWKSDGTAGGTVLVKDIAPG
jgi:ELWxxDGT repeat protein